jgi:uncharacterized protein (TIGR02466 family)
VLDAIEFDCRARDFGKLSGRLALDGSPCRKGLTDGAELAGLRSALIADAGLQDSGRENVTTMQRRNMRIGDAVVGLQIVKSRPLMPQDHHRLTGSFHGSHVHVHASERMLFIYGSRRLTSGEYDRRRKGYAMTTRMNIAVRGLFATAVAALEIPGADERNAELSNIILKKRETSASVQASNPGGWQSDREIAAWGGPQVAFILDPAKEMANRLIADRNGKSVQPKWSVMAWANVNGPGDGNICHYHPGAFWSGTYYVADGGWATDPSLGGEFEMLDPRGSGPGMHAPSLKFMGEDGQSVGAPETIRPRPDLVFRFPLWLFHQVRPYRGNALRISIAFNLRV